MENKQKSNKTALFINFLWLEFMEIKNMDFSRLFNERVRALLLDGYYQVFFFHRYRSRVAPQPV